MIPGFRFVEDPHGYFFDEKPVPSPSTVFADLGLVNPAFFTPGSRARGRAVHAGIHYALKGTLDWYTLDPDLHGFVKSALRLVDRLKPKLIRYETALYHPIFNFAGTMDLEWELEGWRWILDWKSGKAPKVTQYQTSAYEILARVTANPSKLWKRAAIELQRDGSTANLVRYEDHTDTVGWLNLLGAFKIRQALRAGRLAEYYPQGEEDHVAFN